MKKATALLIILTLAVAVFSACGAQDGEKIKIGVCLYKYDDTYISTVRQEIESLAKNNVELFLNDGKGDQGTQNDQIDLLIQKQVDVLAVNLVDVGAAQTVINKAKDADIPIIFFNREPSADIINSYDKAIFVGTNARDAGVIQGEIVTKIWKGDEKYDKNKDGVLDYVMLKGEPDNPEAVARSEYSIKTINENDIKTNELGLQVCNWDTELANSAMSGWLSKFGDRIEFVIANNDSMAQGAISALQSIGYNKGDAEKFVPVVGVDATDAAKDLISKGYMSATVLQDGKAMGKAIYTIAQNIANGRDNLYNTEYKYDEGVKAVRIPYSAYDGK